MGQRLALLVATSQYVDPGLRRLRAPVEEAKQLHELLEDPEVGAFDSAKVLVNESKVEIERRIEELFLRRQPDDLILLYLSGHGIKNDYDRLFFAASDTDLATPHSTAIPASFVHTLIEECQAGVKAVVLDCCYSGAFSTAFRAKSASNAVDLENQLVGRGTYVITATNELEYAYEGETLVIDRPQAQSVFTAALIEGLRTGEADTNRDGLITADELYQYLYEVVQRDGRQTPTRVDRTQGSFLLARVPTRLLVRRSSSILPTSEAYLSRDPVDLLPLLGLADPMSFDVAQAWQPRPLRDQLRVPFAVDELGQPVELDIKELAHEGMGPHGLCIGGTGSGKSELLRTLLLGLLATHSPSTLNMILVDFKGGATFLGLDGAPHVAAVITNLAGDLTLVDRMKDAIASEVARRQEVLAKGNFKNVWDYERARKNRADLDPLPALFICIDEFFEMLTAQPDFIAIFLQIGRVGRSLGIHLLLASQRFEEVKLRGLDTFMSYRICLRTFSAAESRSVLGVPDAFELPSIPGSGYLQYDANTMVRFKAAYVSGPYRSRQTIDEEGGGVEPSVLDVMVQRLAGQGAPARRVAGTLRPDPGQAARAERSRVQPE